MKSDSLSALFIARRFVWASRRYLFSRFLTGVAVGGVALGVFAMTLVLAIMGGFRTHLERKLLGFAPHLTVRADEDVLSEATLIDRVRQVDPAAVVVPMVEGEAIVHRTGDDAFGYHGVKVLGLDPAQLVQWRSVTWQWRDGAQPPLRATDGHPTIVLGNELAFSLGLTLLDDERVQLVAPFGVVTPSGELAPSIREYVADGMLRTGFYEHDAKLVVMQRDEASRLLGPQAAPKWAVYLARPSRAPVVAAQLRDALGPHVEVESWQQQNRKLFGALRLERVVMSILLALMILIASCSICGVLFMQVAWRRRDLAMLSAIGAQHRFVRRVLLHVGTWIGLVGSSTGLAAALGVGAWLQRHPIRLPASFYLDHLPVEFHPGGCLAIGVFGVLLAIFAAWWPAMQAGRLIPAEALRYE